MFKVSAEPTFTHTVKVRVPVDKGFKEESFRATFRVLGPDEIGRFDTGTVEGSLDFLRAIVVRLDDVGDVEGKPVEFSGELLEQVLRLPYARRALATTYYEAVNGARQGN